MAPVFPETLESGHNIMSLWEFDLMQTIYLMQNKVYLLHCPATYSGTNDTKKFHYQKQCKKGEKKVNYVYTQTNARKMTQTHTQTET